MTLMFMNPVSWVKNISRLIRVILALVLFFTLIKKNRSVPAALGGSLLFYFVLGILL